MAPPPAASPAATAGLRGRGGLPDSQESTQTGTVKPHHDLFAYPYHRGGHDPQFLQFLQGRRVFHNIPFHVGNTVFGKEPFHPVAE